MLRHPPNLHNMLPYIIKLLSTKFIFAFGPYKIYFINISNVVNSLFRLHVEESVDPLHSPRRGGGITNCSGGDECPQVLRARSDDVDNLMLYTILTRVIENLHVYEFIFIYIFCFCLGSQRPWRRSTSVGLSTRRLWI